MVTSNLKPSSGGGVAVGGLGLGVLVGRGVTVGVGVSVAVGEGVAVGVSVGVLVGVGVGVWVAVGVGVLVGVEVAVAVGVGVSLGMAVGVAVGVEVGTWATVVAVGSGAPQAASIVISSSRAQNGRIFFGIDSFLGLVKPIVPESVRMSISQRWAELRT